MNNNEPRNAAESQQAISTGFNHTTRHWLHMYLKSWSNPHPSTLIFKIFKNLIMSSLSDKNLILKFKMFFM